MCSFSHPAKFDTNPHLSNNKYLPLHNLRMHHPGGLDVRHCVKQKMCCGKLQKGDFSSPITVKPFNTTFVMPKKQ